MESATMVFKFSVSLKTYSKRVLDFGQFQESAQLKYKTSQAASQLIDISMQHERNIEGEGERKKVNHTLKAELRTVNSALVTGI